MRNTSNRDIADPVKVNTVKWFSSRKSTMSSGSSNESQLSQEVVQRKLHRGGVCAEHQQERHCRPCGSQPSEKVLLTEVDHVQRFSSRKSTISSGSSNKRQTSQEVVQKRVHTGCVCAERSRLIACNLLSLSLSWRDLADPLGSAPMAANSGVSNGSDGGGAAERGGVVFAVQMLGGGDEIVLAASGGLDSSGEVPCLLPSSASVNAGFVLLERLYAALFDKIFKYSVRTKIDI